MSSDEDIERWESLTRAQDEMAIQLIPLSANSDAFADRWEKLTREQDSFVASLITRANKVEPASTSTSTSNSTSFDFSEMKEELEKNVAISADLRAQHERDVNTIEHLEQTNRELNAKLGRAVQEIHRRAPPNPVATPLPPVTRYGPPASSNSSVPFILVLIDGSSAPFSDASISGGQSGGSEAATQVAWEVEKDMRAFDIPIESDDTNEPPLVLTIIWYNKSALVYALSSAKVIRDMEQFDDFVYAFNRSPLSFMMDIGENQVEPKMGACINLLGPLPGCKRVYCVGVHPIALTSACPYLVPRDTHTLQARRLSRIIPKLVVVNHRESEADRIELMKSGWRVTVWSRFFSGNSGLGGDWGWSFAENNDEHTHDASDSEEECKVQKAKGSGRRPVAEMEGFPKNAQSKARK